MELVQNMEKDILEPLGLEELEQMLEITKKSMPKSIRGHHYLFNYIKWLKNSNTNGKLSTKCNVNFYGHRNGNINNCTYIAITGEEDYWIFLHTLEETGRELAECLEGTKRINFQQRPIFLSVENQYFTPIKDVLMRKSMDWEFSTPETISFLPKSCAKDLDLVIPDDVYLARLTLKDAHTINNVWPHKYHGSYDLISTVIERNGGLGVFRKHTNDLIAWSATNNYYSPGFLQTVESERRKGYGSLVFKAECKRIAEQDDIDIIGIVVQGNRASETLLNNLGFKDVSVIHWIEMHK